METVPIPQDAYTGQNRSRQLDIIVLMGAERSGKSTLAKKLVETHGYMELQFAAPLRKVVVELWNGCMQHSMMATAPQLTEAATSDQTLKEMPLHPALSITPRKLMQWIGTDVMRRHVGDDVWVHAAMHALNAAYAAGQNKFVISDCRFANEHAALSALQRDRGARVVFVRLVRGDRDAAVAAARTSGHASAQGWIDLAADHEFQNPCTEDWLETTAAMLAKL